jgi:peptidoglycan biosynthesis protein MviN/MurJ (putative lipid II flippase)
VGLGGLFIGGSLGQITVTSLYAVGDTRTPTRIGILTFTLYLPLKIWLFFTYGVLGLAVAISAFFIVNLLAQWYSIEKRMVADVAAHAQAGEMIA